MLGFVGGGEVGGTPGLPGGGITLTGVLGTGKSERGVDTDVKSGKEE